MLIIDAHLDLAWNALQWNRDLRCEVNTLRARESKDPAKGRRQNTVSLPALQAGRVAVSLATLLARSTGNAAAHIDYSSPEQAFGVAQGQLQYYKALAKQGHVVLIETQTELQNHIQTWEGWEATPNAEPPRPGLVISMESADSILAPEDIPAWFEAGLRVIGPAHYGPGRYAGGTATESGLTALGQSLLPQMETAGMVLDLTHLSDQAFWEAVKLFGGSVLASHNNCRALVPHQRQFSDAQLKLIIERDGVVGTALDAWMLEPGWIIGQSRNDGVTLNTVVDHIDHVCQLAGNSHHAGIGSDLDGGFGREQSPADLNTIADLQTLPGLLAERGYNEDDIANIMYRNWQRLLARSLPPT